MRCALVTGATGGLGRALVRALIGAGYAVRASGRDAQIGAELAAMGASFVPADLTDANAGAELVRGVDVVFHAAALASPWGPAAAFQAINVTATARLLDAAKACGCDAFVFISTPSVYAEPRDRLGLTEASPLAPRFANAYVATKHAAETLVRAADGPGFSTIVLRPHALVGPHDKVLLPRVVRVARRGRFPLFRGGQALVDLTDVRDAAAAIVAADQARGALAGQTLNLSGGAPRPVAEILRQVFDGLGLRPRLIEVPYPLAAFACGCAEAVCAALPSRPEPPATTYSLATLAFSRTFDLTAARAKLVWAPRVSPEAAIARTIAAWRTCAAH